MVEEARRRHLLLRSGAGAGAPRQALPEEVVMAHVFSPAAAPLIPGWATRFDPDSGKYVAERLESLTSYQVTAGCRARVEASTPEELDWLCAAWRTHAEVVRRAEEASRGA